MAKPQLKFFYKKKKRPKGRGIKPKARYARNNQAKRLDAIKKLEFVDEAMLGKLGNEEDKYEVIEQIKPNIICFGYDQNSFNDGLSDELIKRNLSANIIRIGSHIPEKYKPSKMIDK